MHISDLIPDKDSLLTRNYWWRRAQLGLPAPEFEPMQGLNTCVSRSESYPGRYCAGRPSSAQRAGQDAESKSNRQPAATGAASGPTGYICRGSGGGASQAQSGSPNQNLSASARPSSSSAGGRANRVNSETRSPAQRTDVQLPAPEIDWAYAVIERIDQETLKTKLIPFDLGKLVLQHDASQDLELQPNDVVTIFSEADVRVPVDEQTKLVRLEGEFVHAGIYTVLPGETLRELVERAGGFTPNAYLYGSEFTRESTRAIQQARIDEYVASMNLSIQRGTLALVTAPAATPQDVASGAGRRRHGAQLLATLKQIRATGRIVLQFKPDSQGVATRARYSHGRRGPIHRAAMPSSVNVVGAVYDQNSFLYAQGQTRGHLPANGRRTK